jgi:ketosteroid isomerase-like protein
MPQADPIPALTSMLQRTIGDRLVGRPETFLEMCSEEILFEFPYAPEDGVHELRGKEQLAEYLPNVPKMLIIRELVPTSVLWATDGEQVVVEFKADGEGRETGIPYLQSYISVIRIIGGRIVHYRDYWNPLAAIRSAGGVDAMRALLAGEDA